MTSRNTPTRRHLLAELENTDRPVSAAELHQALVSAGLDVNKTTVYRQLDALVAEGLASELDLGEGIRRYELHHDNGEHAHFICTECGDVYCLPVDETVLARGCKEAEARGFAVTSCSLELRGVCSSCAAREAH